MRQKQPFVSLTLADETGSASKMRFWSKNGLEAATVMGAADNIRLLLSSLSSAVCTRQSVTYPYFNEAPAPAVPGVEVEKVGVFVFTSATDGQYVIVEVPGILDECIVQDGWNAGLQIDETNVSVIAFVEAITSGLYCTPFGYETLSLVGTIVERRSK